MDSVFFSRVQALSNQSPAKGVSGVLKSLGLSTSKGTAWKDGSIPKGDILLKLANYFNVSTDYLLGNTDDPQPAGANAADTPVPFQLTDKARKMLDIFLSLDEAAQNELLHYAEYIASHKTDAPMPAETHLA